MSKEPTKTRVSRPAMETATSPEVEAEIMSNTSTKNNEGEDDVSDAAPRTRARPKTPSTFQTPFVCDGTVIRDAAGLTIANCGASHLDRDDRVKTAKWVCGQLNLG